MAISQATVSQMQGFFSSWQTHFWVIHKQFQPGQAEAGCSSKELYFLIVFICGEYRMNPSEHYALPSMCIEEGKLKKNSNPLNRKLKW